MLDKQISYLINSINDSQGIIRSIDTKIGILIAILSFPIPNIGKIYFSLSYILRCSHGFVYLASLFITITFFCFWLLSFYVAIKGVIAIGNPIYSVLKTNVATTGSFYLGDLFKYKTLDVFLNLKSTKSSRTLEEQIALMPTNEVQLISELVYEQMKVVFIRDKKILRLQLAFYLTIIWLIEGFIIYLLFKRY